MYNKNNMPTHNYNNDICEYISKNEINYSPKDKNKIIQKYLYEITFDKLNFYNTEKLVPTEEQHNKKIDSRLFSIALDMQHFSHSRQLIKLIHNEKINLFADEEAFLSFAVDNNEDIARFLVERGADYTARNKSIIAKAINRKKFDFLKAIQNDGYEFSNQDLKLQVSNHEFSNNHNTSLISEIMENFNSRLLEKPISEIQKIMDSMSFDNRIEDFPIIYNEIINKCPSFIKSKIDKTISIEFFSKFDNKLASDPTLTINRNSKNIDQIGRAHV